jgi:hypothetical protein
VHFGEFGGTNCVFGYSPVALGGEGLDLRIATRGELFALKNSREVFAKGAIPGASCLLPRITGRGEHWLRGPQ